MAGGRRAAAVMFAVSLTCVRFVYDEGQSVSAIISLPDGMRKKVSRAALRAAPP